IVGVDVSSGEAIDDDFSGVEFVVGADFFGGHFGGDGDGAVEIVGVGGAETWDVAAGLGEAGGGEGMGVNDAADGLEGSVQVEMGWGVGRGAVFSVDDLAGFEGEDDDVVGFENVVGDAAGFDGHDSGLAIDAASVPPSENNQAGLDEGEVGAIDAVFQFFKTHGGDLWLGWGEESHEWHEWARMNSKNILPRMYADERR